MAQLPKFTLSHNDKKDKWDLKKDSTNVLVKSFSTKEKATLDLESNKLWYYKTRPSNNQIDIYQSIIKALCGCNYSPTVQGIFKEKSEVLDSTKWLKY